MRASGRLLLQRLLLCVILLAPGTPSVLTQEAAVKATVARALAESALVTSQNALTQSDRAQLLNTVPTPSGADPLYPLNHSFDATGEALGPLVDNADFETAATDVGTPPTNHDFETAVATVGDQPENHDFATGDFTDWTTTGSVSIDADPTRGSWARLDASGETMTSSAFTVDASAQVFTVEVGYLSTTSTSAVRVYVLTGPTYSTSTLLGTFSCYQCGTWKTQHLNAAAYVGQSVKLQFGRYVNGVGIDNVAVQEILPGWTISAEATRWIEAGGNAYARLSDGMLTSSAFTIDSTAQYLSLRLHGLPNLSDQYRVYLLSGANYATSTQLTAGAASDSWETLRFNMSGWHGQSVKLRISRVTGTIELDDVGLQRIEVPDWDATGTAYLESDGAGGHYVSTNGTLTSDAVTLPADVQQFSLRLRGGSTSATVYLELLRGATFSDVVYFDYVALDSSQWTTRKFSISLYAGETVKFRIRQWFGRGLYDDVGLGEIAVPGWTMTTTGAVRTGSDSHGSYVTPYDPQAAMFLRTSPLSTGIIDRPGTPDYRYYAISYEIGFSSSSLFQVFWVNQAGTSWTVLQEGASSPTGYRTRYFFVADSHGLDGRFVVKSTGGGKVYAFADNIARQQLNEPFSRKVGLQIDTSTGSFGYRQQDLATSGALPMVLTRSYVGQSDQYGTLGFRWSHSFDTRLQIDPSDGDAAVLFGSGGAEFFRWNSIYGTFTGADARTYSTLVKNGDGSFSYTTKSLLTFQFDAAGVLTGIEDRNGNTLSLSYDLNGRLATVTDPANQSLTFAYDGNGRLASVSDPVGAVVAYAYDANGDLVSVTDPEDGVTTYAYNQHRLTTVTDPNNKTLFTNTYDEWHRVTSQADALNKTITLAYDTPGKGATAVTDPEQHTATYYFDRSGRTTD